MNTTQKTLGSVAAAGVLALGGLAVASAVDSGSPTTMAVSAPATTNCNDWSGQFTNGECQAAGIIRFVALYNLQGAAQFCKWKAANPGEWSRLNTYAGTAALPTPGVVTWMGASIKNELEAYFVTGAPTMTYKLPNGTTVAGIAPNTSPNKCGGKVLAAPAVVGVQSGETDVTVTVAPTP